MIPIMTRGNPGVCLSHGTRTSGNPITSIKRINALLPKDAFQLKGGRGRRSKGYPGLQAPSGSAVDNKTRWGDGEVVTLHLGLPRGPVPHAW